MSVTVTVSQEFLDDQLDCAHCSYWAYGWNAKTVQPREGARELPLDWQRAAQIAADKYPRLLDANRMDAETGDMWVQLAAYGEIVYG